MTVPFSALLSLLDPIVQVERTDGSSAVAPSINTLTGKRALRALQQLIKRAAKCEDHLNDLEAVLGYPFSIVKLGEATEWGGVVWTVSKRSTALLRELVKADDPYTIKLLRSRMVGDEWPWLMDFHSFKKLKIADVTNHFGLDDWINARTRKKPGDSAELRCAKTLYYRISVYRLPMLEPPPNFGPNYELFTQARALAPFSRRTSSAWWKLALKLLRSESSIEDLPCFKRYWGNRAYADVPLSERRGKVRDAIVKNIRQSFLKQLPPVHSK